MITWPFDIAVGGLAVVPLRVYFEDRRDRHERGRLRRIEEAYLRETKSLDPLWEFRPTAEQATRWVEEHPEI